MLSLQTTLTNFLKLKPTLLNRSAPLKQYLIYPEKSNTSKLLRFDKGSIFLFKNKKPGFCKPGFFYNQLPTT
ncbi:MAG: hypothetical protein DRH03_02045 [Deltaproteobacteria bacterium]|nr:MAG: hypothetical protein DRH03_02045 [Deltaproteobacteria bacterium]